MTYTEQAYKAAELALEAFYQRTEGFLWTMSDADEYTRLTNRLTIISAFYKALK